MNTNKMIHRNVVLPTLPDHSESRKFQNMVMTVCLGLSLLCALSLVIVVM